MNHGGVNAIGEPNNTPIQLNDSFREVNWSHLLKTLEADTQQMPDRRHWVGPALPVNYRNSRRGNI